VLPDKMYIAIAIAIDGTGVPVVRAEAEGRPGKGEDGRSRHPGSQARLCVHPDQGR